METTVETTEDTTVITEEDSIITISTIEITIILIVGQVTIITVEEMAQETRNLQIMVKHKIEIHMVQMLLGWLKILGTEGILEGIIEEEDKGMIMGNIEVEGIAMDVAEEEEVMADITRQATKEINNNYRYVSHVKHHKASTK